MLKRYIRGFLAAAGLIVLILDTQPALNGVRNGLEVCSKTVIPSLLPFLILSKYLSGSILGARIPVFLPIAKLCGVPEGMESVIGIGMIGGYPVGAQTVADAYQQRVIDKATAERLLGFCNNAGPAFIFGISAAVFSHPGIGWVILMIQIISAMCVGILLPGKSKAEKCVISGSPVSMTHAVESGIRSMAIICGWILCFRVVLVYTEQYIKFTNPLIQVIYSGILELSNGCIELSKLNNEAIRLVIMSGMLSLGGLCVWMQTRAVTNKLQIKWFIIGKILQCTISVFLALILHLWIFPENIIENCLRKILLSAGIAAAEIFCIYRKIIVATWRKILYNTQKKFEMRDHNAVSQTD